MKMLCRLGIVCCALTVVVQLQAGHQFDPLVSPYSIDPVGTYIVSGLVRIGNDLRESLHVTQDSYTDEALTLEMYTDHVQRVAQDLTVLSQKHPEVTQKLSEMISHIEKIYEPGTHLTQNHVAEISQRVNRFDRWLHDYLRTAKVAQTHKKIFGRLEELNMILCDYLFTGDKRFDRVSAVGQFTQFAKTNPLAFSAYALGGVGTVGLVVGGVLLARSSRAQEEKEKREMQSTENKQLNREAEKSLKELGKDACVQESFADLHSPSLTKVMMSQKVAQLSNEQVYSKLSVLYKALNKQSAALKNHPITIMLAAHINLDVNKIQQLCASALTRVNVRRAATSGSDDHELEIRFDDLAVMRRLITAFSLAYNLVVKSDQMSNA